jgi:RecB family exonuclease
MWNACLLLSCEIIGKENMALNPEFQFNQSNLQDYATCPRKFELRYIERRRWPALQSEPVLEQERQMQQGLRFHRMAHQHILNIPVDHTLLAAEDGDLADWWEQFLQSDPLAKLPPQRYPEHTLSARLDGFQITAKYDLLAVDPGKCAVIVDWKTGRPPKASRLKDRLQSRLYPYLLVEAGAYLNGGASIRPEQVQMIYWFASAPTSPIVYAYDQAAYLADQKLIAGLIAEICACPPAQFMLAVDERACLFCVYRSLCGRGIKAGDWTEIDEESNEETPFSIDFDPDQIGEIAF